jgi:hypothetical protein
MQAHHRFHRVPTVSCDQHRDRVTLRKPSFSIKRRHDLPAPHDLRNGQKIVSLAGSPVLILSNCSQVA